MSSSRGKFMPSELKCIKKNMLSTKADSTQNRNKTNTPPEQSSNFHKNMVVTNIKQESSELFVEILPENTLISDTSFPKQSNNEWIQHSFQPECTNDDTVNLIKIADTYSLSEIAKDIKKEVLDSPLSNNLENPTSKQSGGIATEISCENDDASMQQMSANASSNSKTAKNIKVLDSSPRQINLENSKLKQSGCITDSCIVKPVKNIYVKDHIKKELNDSTKICENMIQNNSSKNEINISKKQIIQDSVEFSDCTVEIPENVLKIKEHYALCNSAQSDENINNKIPLRTKSFNLGNEEKLDTVCVTILDDTPKINSNLSSRHTKSSNIIVITLSDDEIDLTSSKNNVSSNECDMVISSSQRNSKRSRACKLKNISSERSVVVACSNVSSSNLPIKSEENEHLFSSIVLGKKSHFPVQDSLKSVCASASATQILNNEDFPVTNHPLASSLGKIDAELTKGEVTSASNDVVQNSRKDKKNSDLSLYEIQDKLCNSFHSSKNDENDIVKLEYFPVLEEEVSAYANIIKEFHNIMQYSRKKGSDFDHIENVFNLFNSDLKEKEYLNNTLENMPKSNLNSSSVVTVNYNQQLPPDNVPMVNIASNEVLPNRVNSFALSNSVENSMLTSDCCPSSDIVLHEKHPLTSLAKSPEINNIVHSTLNISLNHNNAIPFSSVDVIKKECQELSNHITSGEKENIDGSSYKSSLKNDDMMGKFDQPMLKVDKTINKDLCSSNEKKNIPFCDGNNRNEDSNYDYESDSTLPYNENRELSEAESASATKVNKDDKGDTECFNYTSKLKKYTGKTKCLIEEQDVQIKKSKTLVADPRLSKMRKYREKAVFSNPLTEQSDSLEINKNDQYFNEKCRKTTKNSESENKTTSKSKAGKSTLAKESYTSKVLMDNEFMPKYKIVQKPEKNSHKKRPFENDSNNASFVTHGNQTVNHGTFLTKSPSGEPFRKSQRKLNFPQKITIETMHIMAESPQIKAFDNNCNLNLPIATQSIMGTTISNNQPTEKYEPSKVNFNQYTKKQKTPSAPRRDVSPGFSRTNIQWSVPLSSGEDMNCWSPLSSNSSCSSSNSSFQKQTNTFQRIPQPNMYINQNFSPRSYLTSAVSSPKSFSHFNTEPLHQESTNFPLLPASNLSCYLISPTGKPRNSVPNHEVETSKSSVLNNGSISSSFAITPPPKGLHHFGIVRLNSKGSSSLVPKTIRARIGQKYIKSEHMILLVLEWSVNWLAQQQKMHTPPPITSRSSHLKQVVDTYNTFEDHYNTYFPLLLLELWGRLYHAWTHIANIFLHCDIDSFYSVTEFSNVELVTFVTELDLQKKKYPEGGSVVIMRFVCFDGSNLKMFGFIKEASFNNGNWQSDPQYKRYGSISNEQCLMLRLTVICAYNAIDINLDKKVQIQVICNIKAQLKQNDALVNAKKSPLGQTILKPKGGYVFTVPLSSCESNQDETILQTVKDVVLSLPSQLPQLTIVNVLCSSDRITTLVCLVEEIKKLQHKVLLCTRTKAAFEKICFNLENRQLDMVILSAKSDVDLKLRKYTLDERASLLIKEHSLSKHSKTTKESVFRAKKVIIEKCDIILSLIQNCHDDVVEEAVNEDSHISLTCVIDEANLCTEPESLIPLMYRISKIFLIGDLSDPARVCSQTAIDNNYNRSLFKRVYSLNADGMS